MARIPPVPRREWPASMREALAAMVPPVRTNPEPALKGRPRANAVMDTFAHHTDLARAFFTFNGHILWGSTLSSRQCELIALRVGARRRSAFLWAQHQFPARDAGLTEDEIGRIAFGPDAPYWAPLDRALLRVDDELVHDGVVSDPTWAALAAELDVKQLLDVVFTAGTYETVSWFFNSVDLEPDPTIPDLLRAATTGDASP